MKLLSVFFMCLFTAGCENVEKYIADHHCKADHTYTITQFMFVGKTMIPQFFEHTVYMCDNGTYDV